MQAVIIAAGESSRFWPLNKSHKSQIYLLGKPLIYWMIKGLSENGIKDVIVVCRPNSSMQEMLDKENDLGIKISYVVQKKPLGTGNALWQARDLIRESFFVMWPDKVDSRGIVAQMIAKQKEVDADMALAGSETSNPQDYGIARFDGERVVEIVENPEPGKEPSLMKIMGARFFQQDFFEYYAKLPIHHEADYVDATNVYLREKKSVLVAVSGEGHTVKYPWDLFGILELLFGSESFQSSIAPTAKIAKSVIIEGPVIIGERTVIKEGTILQGPCFIGNDCEIGFSNVLRGPFDMEDYVLTGAFCEIKHSIVQRGTHFHSGYVGDSIIGENCRFGAGFVTGNRRFDRTVIQAAVKDKKVSTGFNAFGVAIGDDSSFGIHSGTMPGVLIGSHCQVGPGTLVFENIEDNTVFYVKSQIRSTKSKRELT